MFIWCYIPPFAHPLANSLIHLFTQCLKQSREFLASLGDLGLLSIGAFSRSKQNHNDPGRAHGLRALGGAGCAYALVCACQCSRRRCASTTLAFVAVRFGHSEQPRVQNVASPFLTACSSPAFFPRWNHPVCIKSAPLGGLRRSMTVYKEAAMSAQGGYVSAALSAPHLEGMRMSAVSRLQVCFHLWRSTSLMDTFGGTPGAHA